MSPLTDTAEIVRIALLRSTLAGGDSTYNAVAVKLNGIGELLEKLHQTSDQHSSQICEMSVKMTHSDNKIEGVEAFLRDYEQRTD